MAMAVDAIPVPAVRQVQQLAGTLNWADGRGGGGWLDGETSRNQGEGTQTKQQHESNSRCFLATERSLIICRRNTHSIHGKTMANGEGGLRSGNIPLARRRSATGNSRYPLR
jgi:hypothetical protein